MRKMRLLQRMGLVALMGLAGPADAKVAFAGFDLEGHRGARDERPENTLAAFAHALEVGVSTLELDLAVTRDGQVVVTHNQHLEPSLARHDDGRWATDKPLVYSLTLAELKTFDVGGVNPLDPYWLAHGRFQQAIPGERIPTLAEVFELTRRYGADRVNFNIETKIDPRKPDNTPDPATFSRKVLDVVRQFGVRDRVMVQSFDWRTLAEVRRMDKDVTLVALTAEQPLWGADGLYREVGRAGCSPWMAGHDIDDHGGDFVTAAKLAHANVISPYHGEVTPDVVAQARRLGLKVVPWTVNEIGDMTRLIEMGVDGLITDRPTVLRKVLQERGMAVPPPVLKPAGGV
jgi:glycerophosphoryl diester phosphodiesterase